MGLDVEKLYQLPAEEAYPYYKALWFAGMADAAIHLRGADIAYSLGRLQSAHHALMEALACKPEGELKGKVEFYRATVLRQIGHLDKAIDIFTRWISNLDAAYPTLRDTYLGAAYHNRGLALRQAKRYRESIEDYERASKEFRRINQSDWLRLSLQNLAWVACLAGAHHIAGEALTEAAPLCASDDASWHQMIGQAFLFTVSPQGDQGKAMELCREIQDSTDPTVPAAVRSHAYWLAGQILLASQRLAEAKSMAEQAMVWGAKLGHDDRCLADASALWQDIQQRMSQRQGVV